MIAIMLALAAVAGGAARRRRVDRGAVRRGGSFRDRFVALSYQAAPAAMISLLLGLGVDLFKLLPQAAATPIKIAALAGAVVWGAALGRRILGRHGAARSRRRRRAAALRRGRGDHHRRVVAGCRDRRADFF